MKLRRGRRPARAFNGSDEKTLLKAIKPAKQTPPFNDVSRIEKAGFYEGPGADEMIRAEKGPRRPFIFEEEKPEPKKTKEDAWAEFRESYKKIVKDPES